MAQPIPSSLAPTGVATTASRPIRVMIVDDSITARTVLSRIVEGEEDMAVAATANSAEQALQRLCQEQVDVILLDLEMPGMGGLAALPDILKAARGAKVMVVSSLTLDGAEPTVAALSLGAADTLPKPAVGQFTAPYRQGMLAKIRALGRSEPTWKASPPIRSRQKSREVATIVAIGASTGGIHAMSLLFAALPRRLPVPILVTQHLPASFMPVFARQLEGFSGYPTGVARDRTPVRPGQILVAPGDGHLVVEKKGDALIARISRVPAPSGFMPSVDPMFHSLAECAGANALGVMLSGMGRDGCEGAGQLVERGGCMFAQDQESSAVWGMPRGVAEAGIATAILPPREIAMRITASTGASQCM